MPKHLLMSEIEIIPDGGRRRYWTASDKLRIVEETLDEGAGISAAMVWLQICSIVGVD